VKDRWRGFLRGLRSREFDHFSDHSIARYIQYIRAAVDEEKATARRFGRPRRKLEMPRRAAA
jgi:triacylglycerol lipase